MKKKPLFFSVVFVLVMSISLAIFAAPTLDDLKKVFVTRDEVLNFETSISGIFASAEFDKQVSIQNEVGYQMYRRGLRLPTEEGSTIDPSLMSSWSERRSRELETMPSSIAPPSPTVDGTNWMSQISDSTPLNAINIPGTHDSATAGITDGPTILGISIPITKGKTQSLSIIDQLNAGVRFFDLRVDASGNMCHGEGILKFNCNKTFVSALDDINDWLDTHTTETVIIAPRLEDGSDWTAINNALNTTDVPNLSTTTTWPTMGSARKKIVVCCFKNGKITKPCINFPSFPDNNDSSSISAGGKTFSISDKYSIGQLSVATVIIPDPDPGYTLDTKKTSVNNYLSSAGAIDNNNGRILFASAYDYTKVVSGMYPSTDNPITTVSTPVNDILKNYSYTKGNQYGYILMDFVTADLCKKIWESNSGL